MADFNIELVGSELKSDSTALRFFSLSFFLLVSFYSFTITLINVQRKCCLNSRENWTQRKQHYGYLRMVEYFIAKLCHIFLRTQPNPWISLRICSEHSLLQIAFNFTRILCFFNSFSSYFEWKFCSKQAVFKLFKKHIFQFELAPVAHTHKICCSRSFLLIYFFQNSHCKSDYNH